MVTRRRVVMALGASALTVPLTSFPQPTKVYRVGFLFAGTLAKRPQAQGFWQGLHELGYTPGKNVLIEVREAEGKVERLPQLAQDLVNWKPDVIVAVTPSAIRAAKEATRSIPIVMAVSGRPAELGHVNNLTHPEGNVTGTAQNFDELYSKQLQLLKEILPNLARVGVVWNAKSNGTTPKVAEAAAVSLAIRLQSVALQGPTDLEGALATAVREKCGALLVLADPVTFDNRATIIAFAAANRLPTMHLYVDEVLDGGLASYGINLREEYRRVAPYVDKILKGAKPGDLPVEQTTRLEFAINVKTAKALGIKLPNSIMVQATKVIE